MADKQQPKGSAIHTAAGGDVSRRGFTLGAAGLAFGAGFSSFADFAHGQAETPDDHYYFFVELRGGIQWMVATDGRDLDSLPLDNPRLVHKLALTDTPLTPDEYSTIVRGESYRKNSNNGKFILLPYVGDLQSSYVKGTTGLGCDHVLGFAAASLKPYVDDLAVVRGVLMQGDFHGIANATGEIFSGMNTGESPHVAAVMAQLLAQKYGPRLLDNLVFENATYAAGNSELAMPPVRLDAQSLGYIVGGAGEQGSEGVESRFVKARSLADALSRTPSLTDLHRKTFQSYIAAMTQAPAVRANLLTLTNELGAADASLDLGLQFKTGWALMQSGLARVVTLCLGAPNGKNKVDGFGLFDAHQGVYHLNPESEGTVNSQRHHLNVEKAMGVIGDFVKQLKSTPYGATGKTWADVATVVISTDFARPSNFTGNEASGSSTGTAFGNGHCNFNNNYLLFGKGVRGGAWLGKNDPITQMAYTVDFATVDAADPNAVAMAPTAMRFEPETEGASEAEGEGFFSPENLDPLADKRPFMAKDMVRTIMGTAGFDARFAEVYAEPLHVNAKTIKSILKG